MIEFEEKFIVMNRKYLKDIPGAYFSFFLAMIEAYVPNNKYYVCNQDEPYANEVLRIILEGEEAKMND